MSGRILWETANADTGLRATQTDADHVTLEVIVDGTNHVLRLPASMAVALGVVLLHANLGHLAEFAERLTDEASGPVVLALLGPAMRRELEREALAAMPPGAKN